MSSKMECTEAREKLSEALDRGLTDEEKDALSAHLEDCATCRAQETELKELHAVVSDLAQPAAASPDDEAVLARLWRDVGDEPPGDEDPLQDYEETLDSSGLHDVRELAAAVQAGYDEAGGSVHDLFGLSSSTDVEHSAPTAAVVPPPVLMPSASRPSWMMPALIAGGVLILGVAALAAVIFVQQGRRQSGRKNDEGQGAAVAANSVSQDERAVENHEAAQPRPMQAASAPVGDRGQVALGGEMAATEGKSKVPAGVASRGVSHRPHGAVRRHMRSAAARHARPASASHPTHARATGLSAQLSRAAGRQRGGSVPARAGGASGDPLASLLSAGTKTKTAPRASSTAGLPQNLSTSSIRRVMSRASGRVHHCYEVYKKSGLIRLRVTVSGATGRPSSVLVRGSFAGTPIGRCAARAVRRLRFPKFSNSSQKFTYPFLLR